MFAVWLLADVIFGSLSVLMFIVCDEEKMMTVNDDKSNFLWGFGWCFGVFYSSSIIFSTVEKVFKIFIVYLKAVVFVSGFY